MKLGTQVGLGSDHIVLDGDPAPPPQRGTAPISAYVCCGQMAGWIKMPLGMEVGSIVLHGTQLPPKGAHPQFSDHVYCGQTVAHLSYCWALVIFLTFLRFLLLFERFYIYG